MCITLYYLRVDYARCGCEKAGFFFIWKMSCAFLHMKLQYKYVCNINIYLITNLSKLWRIIPLNWTGISSSYAVMLVPVSWCWYYLWWVDNNTYYALLPRYCLLYITMEFFSSFCCNVYWPRILRLFNFVRH